MAKLTEKQQKMDGLIKKWIGLLAAIKEWQMHIVLTKMELEKLIHQNDEYHYSPSVLVKRSCEYKDIVDNEAVLEAIGVHVKYRDLFASGAFKPGAVKKLKEIAEFCNREYSDVISLKMLDPKFLGGKNG